VDSVKSRALKALLVGPPTTPYENALFEFDLLIPEDYPFSPPKVTFKTTGGGQVRRRRRRRSTRECLPTTMRLSSPPTIL